jgi:hypothetical protein
VNKLPKIATNLAHWLLRVRAWQKQFFIPPLVANLLFDFLFSVPLLFTLKLPKQEYILVLSVFDT